MQRNGFTLIELLAVILILGIIALIAIPTVNNIIEESEKGAFETSVNNILRTAEDNCQLQILKGEQIVKTYIFTDGMVSPDLNVKGQLPKSGQVLLDSSCNGLISVSNGEYTANKLEKNSKILLSNGETIEDLLAFLVYENGTAVYFNPVTGKKCTAGEAVSTTGIKTGCMKWYTFNDGGKTTETINLILDHNTTAKVAWRESGSNATGPTNILTQLQTDTSSWVGLPLRTDSYSLNNGTANYTIDYSTYRARLITASEVAKISGKTGYVEATATSSVYFYLDSNTTSSTANLQGASKYPWVYDYTNNCTSYGCNIADSSNDGYWTATAVAGSTTIAMDIDNKGALGNDYQNLSNKNGLRPVITISKTLLKN